MKVENKKSESKGLFFCCGNENDEAKYEVEDYDGPPPLQLNESKSQRMKSESLSQ